MTQSIWQINSAPRKGDKNLLIFSIRSVGNATLHSAPAGSNRAVKKQNQNNAQLFDFNIQGNKTKVQQQKKVNAKPGAPTKHAKQAKANPANGNKSAKIKKPASFPNTEWSKMTVSQRSQLVQFMSSKPPQKKAPKPPVDDSINQSDAYLHF